MPASRTTTYHDPSALRLDPGSGHAPRRHAARAGLALVLFLMLIAVAAPAASAAPWSCDAYGYLFQTPDVAVDDNDIIQVDLATGTYDADYADSPEVVNAVGYNDLDNFIYGMRHTYDAAGTHTGTRLVRVHADGSQNDLGYPAGLPTTLRGFATGEVDPDGYYWTYTSDDAGDPHWYKIDVRPGSVTFGQVVDDAKVLAWPTTINGPIGSDWGYVGGSFYSIVPGSPLSPGPHLAKFTPGVGIEDAGPLPVYGGTGTGTAQAGAVYIDSAGNVWASRNDDGWIFRIDPVTLETIAVAQALASTSNDGTRCATAPIPTITVTKTVAGRVRPADQFTVGVVKPDGSPGTSVTTTGGQTTVSTVDYPASQGQTYTITDAMAAGSPTPFGEYVASIACTDGAGSAVVPGGTVGAWTLPVAQATNYTCNVTNRAVSDLVLLKSASPAAVVPGEEVTWTMRVTNNGPSTSIGETVSDQLPAEATFSSASPGCSETGGVVTCAVGELAAGASKEFTVTADVASSLTTCLRNTATVSGQFDADKSNNTATICTPINRRSNLSLLKDPSSATVGTGGQAIYTLVVRNDGPSDEPAVKVTDALVAGLTLVSANPSQGSCTTTDNVVSCDLGALKDGGSAQILVTASVPSSPGCITNTARVQGAHVDPDPGNNQDSAQICVEPPPPPTFDLSVAKQADDPTLLVGQRVTYRVAVRNSGPDAAPGVTLTDTINAPVTVVSARATQGSCERRIPMRCELGTIAAGETVTIRIVVKHREASSSCRRDLQRQAASATGAGTDANPADNLDTVDVCVEKISRLSISKVASQKVIEAGDTLSYRIRVRNPTQGEARNVRVCDRPQSGLRLVGSKPTSQRSGRQQCWTIKRLGAGKRRTFRVTVRVAPGAHGRKTNTATASSPDTRVRARVRSRIQVLGVSTPVTG